MSRKHKNCFVAIGIISMLQYGNLWCIWIPFILLKTENNKKIIFGYYSLLNAPTIHAWDMNSASGTGQKKKKKAKP